MSNEVFAPKINTNDEQVQIVRWHVQNGEYVAKGSPLVDVETTKTIITIEAEFDGYVECYYEIDAIIKVGEPLCRLSKQLSESADIAHKNTPHLLPTMNASESLKYSHSLDIYEKASKFSPINLHKQGIYQSTRFSKAAKDLLKQLNISADKFEGEGLITEAKILRQKQNISQEPTRQSNIKDKTEADHVGPITPREVMLPLSKMAEISQLTIGEKSLVNSSLSVSFDSMKIREAIGHDSMFGSLQALILFEIAQLLVKWPQFTAYCEQQKIHFYDRIDLGLAIDLGMGLKVVSIRNAEKFTVKELSEVTVDFCLRYMRNEILPEELINSTITVTDLSNQDILYFHPLINGYQSAIIGVGGDSSRPEYPMAINMTFDHRVSTGREVAIFLNELKKRILSYQEK